MTYSQLLSVIKFKLGELLPDTDMETRGEIAIELAEAILKLKRID